MHSKGFTGGAGIVAPFAFGSRSIDPTCYAPVLQCGAPLLPARCMLRFHLAPYQFTPAVCAATFNAASALVHIPCTLIRCRNSDLRALQCVLSLEISLYRLEDLWSSVSCTNVIISSVARRVAHQRDHCRLRKGTDSPAAARTHHVTTSRKQDRSSRFHLACYHDACRKELECRLCLSYRHLVFSVRITFCVDAFIAELFQRIGFVAIAHVMVL